MNNDEKIKEEQKNKQNDKNLKDDNKVDIGESGGEAN
jgi:hypothetical protein